MYIMEVLCRGSRGGGKLWMSMVEFWKNMILFLFMNNQWLTQGKGGGGENEMATFSQHGRVFKEYDIVFEHYYFLVLNNVRE